MAIGMNLNHGKPTFLGRFQIMGGAADFKVGYNDDIRYCQDVFCCLPVADIVKRRTAKFLKKYKEANDMSNMYQILTVKLSYTAIDYFSFYYGRTLSERPCYILPMFFKYIFLWAP